MKKSFKFLIPLLLLAGAALGQTTVSVTVDLKSIFSTAQASKVQACFSLVDGNGQQINNPRVTTSGVIVNTTNVCQSPDNTGHLAITLYANDAISPSGSLYQVVYVYSGTPVHGDTYQFLVADGTENLNLKTPVTQSALITPPTGDTTYARLDGGNQPFTNPISACRIGGTYIAGSFCYPKLQDAITAACSAAPNNANVYFQGTFAQNIPFVLCSGLKIQGAGRCQTDIPSTCSSQITTTLSSGDLFPVTNMTDIYLADFAVRSSSAGGANAAIRLNYGQRVVVERLYLNLPGFAVGIELDSSLNAAGSTIWNTFRDIHINGLLTTGVACLLNSSNATNKVINNNSFYNVSCTGGPSGVGVEITNSNNLQNINENYFYAGENATSRGMSGGTGILITSTATRGVVFDQQNTENNKVGFSKANGNTVLNVMGNISANDTNLSDSQPSFTGMLMTSVGGIVQQFSIDQNGGIDVPCVGLNATCTTNLFNGANGWGFGVAGSQVWQFLTSAGEFAPITAGSADIGTSAFPVGNVWIGNAGTNNIKVTGVGTAARVATLPDNTGTIAETNLGQTWIGAQTFSADTTVKRLIVAGATPTCSVTGAGTGATCSVGAASTDSVGAMFINTGTTPTNLGTITLTFTSTFGSNASNCAANLANNGANWNPRGTLIGGWGNNTSVSWNWDNNAVNLTGSTSSAYTVSYVCGAR